VTDFYLRADLQHGALGGVTGAAGLLQWATETADTAALVQVYRNQEGRKTLRIELDGRPFFLKSHRGVGWGEIVKNLLQGRLPIVGAGSEYRAITALESAGVETLSIAAFASRGANPARRRSMILTDELVSTVSLEDFCAPWASRPPAYSLRIRLIITLAGIARRMHDAGINHRDFYLCHFHLGTDNLAQGPLRCYLIDLHRAQCRARTPMRWRIKDLAGLYFSAMDCGLTLRDMQRFARHYHPGGLRQALVENAALWRRVQRAATALYRKANGRMPPSSIMPGGNGRVR
jgi:heptose I phosphotransferase